MNNPDIRTSEDMKTSKDFINETIDELAKEQRKRTFEVLSYDVLIRVSENLKDSESKVKLLEEENKRLNLKVKEAFFKDFGEYLLPVRKEKWEEFARENNINL